MGPRTQKTIDILLDALNNGTLAKGTCAACACGNIIAGSLGIKAEIPKKLSHIPQEHEHWMGVLVKNKYNDSFISRYCPYDYEKGKIQIENSGFTPEEFEKIENSFERNTSISWISYICHTKEEIRKDQIKGLEAVVKVLLEFDDSKEDVKEVFTKRADLIPV